MKICVTRSLSNSNLSTNGKQYRSKARSVIELMRWNRPTGTILALTPALWSIGLSTPTSMMLPPAPILTIFCAGAFVARGMGCTINDLLDRKYDKLVERTQNRPIACGDISPKEATVYLAIQSLVGLGILCLNNATVIQLGLASGFMIASYPLFKRFTYYPQVMLALTINWGVFMGFAAMQNDMSQIINIVPLYLGSICWTLYYDTIYAHQDKKDDALVGIKSTALKFGSHTKPILSVFAAGMMSNLVAAGLLTSQTFPYYACVVLSGLFQVRLAERIDLDNPEECFRGFDQQKYIGLLIMTGVLSSVALKHRRKNSNETQCKISDIKT